MSVSPMLWDTRQRPLRNLRLSVTDRCNLRCNYCMPEEEYRWLSSQDILSFEETSRLVDCFIEEGVRQVRLTGGEPLLRRDLPLLVEMLARKSALRDLALTTNGILLADFAQPLRQAGLHRLTVSLDTLNADTFFRLSRRRELHRVLAGIEAAVHAGFSPLKIDTVLIRGVNDSEIFELFDFAQTIHAEMRFIEYMDVGGATRWTQDQVISRDDIISRMSQRFGPITPLFEKGSAPAQRFQTDDGSVFGVIASTTAPFCHSCDRSRLTADGHWYTCLYAASGVDFRAPLRQGVSNEELRAIIAGVWKARADRGAEERQALANDKRLALFTATQLKENPHLEMHTRGG